MLSASNDGIKAAARAICRGKLVAFPTETVYGLGADATNGQAVARVFEAKARPRLNPLIVHAADASIAEQYGVLNALATELASAFWPGPLSLVVPRRPNDSIADLVTAGLETIALRVPEHPIAQALLHKANCPIAAPSANLSGRTSATTAAHVRDDLDGTPVIILDGGPCPLGIESTIISVINETPRLLRSGVISRKELENAAGQEICNLRHNADHAPNAPGQLASHYAPNAKLRLNTNEPRMGEAFLAFGNDAPTWPGPTINLSPTGNLQEAAANLFGALRKLDAFSPNIIAVSPIPRTGLGEAINDRITRAAAPR